MSIENSGFKENLSVLKDEELRKIIYSESNEYEQEAIDKARSELFSREAGHLWESDNIILKDLLRYAEYEEIIYSFLKLFPEENDTLEEYYKLIDNLINAEVQAENTDASNISIIIDDTSKNFANKNWNVFGKEDNSKDEICLDYFYPTEWLGFKVKKEQLQKFGIETYIAYCLRAMTAMGFSKDEIQENFKCLEKRENIKNLQTLYPQMTDDKSGLFIMDGLPKAKHYFIDDEETNTALVRPWVRYLARYIDFSIWGNLVFISWSILSPITYKNYLLQSLWIKSLVIILIYILWIFIEALLLSKFGYTLGKWILKAKVTSKNGERLTYLKALKRTGKVLVYGCALKFPFLCSIAYIISYNALINNGITKWDREEDTIVNHSEYSTFRGIIAVFLVLLFVLSS
ncbi:RDD family protein [Ruminiclostridium herbifermentans]|uniref:RDD family protein n=1 Tax=Ruminiclostridium herbifermentans TaxID=2488810 RepID=A0A4U7JKK3_9FIRM|nr:RDD family protein [Ruminiclostridium herbifermentans]QNU67017.1 RDD family protein [Ruminiclostridium herbifermentans]